MGLKQPHHRLRITEGMRADLKVWQIFLQTHNGVSIILEDQWFDNKALNMHTDASGEIGIGAIFQTHWISEEWPSWVREMALNKMTCRSKPSMHLVRELVTSCLKNNILVKAWHVPGEKNKIADALSRLQLSAFRARAPSADLHPTLIPPHL